MSFSQAFQSLPFTKKISSAFQEAVTVHIIAEIHKPGIVTTINLTI